jgi:hypothetical protein
MRVCCPQLLATRIDVLSPRMLRIIGDIVDDWKYLDDRTDRVTDEIEARARTDVGCEQLMTVPGIGRIQKRKTNHLQIITFGLQRTAGPYKRANIGLFGHVNSSAESTIKPD